MTDVCLGFEVHQPIRLSRNFNPDFAKDKSLDELFEVYFNNSWNKIILERVAEKCYLPANRIILDCIDELKPEFKVAYSLSGVFLEQCTRWSSEVLDSFKALASTGCVEFLNQTYYHSIASLFDEGRGEFIEQVQMHKQLMKDLLGCEPQVFENTEFIYNNSIARCIEGLGYKGIYCEGAERILGWRSPNYLYKAKDSNIKVLLKNYRLSDDIAFRFSMQGGEYPLTAEKYSAWIAATPGQCVNLFMDYETFGEHHWVESGIFEFLKWLPGEILKYEHLRFSTPSEVVAEHEPVGDIDVGDYDTVSWADIERDVGAWIGNDMQRTCYAALRKLEPYVKRAKGTEKNSLLKLWRYLQISDHLYYMFTSGGAPGIVHGYFSQQTPVEVFHVYTRILSHFQELVSEHLPKKLMTSAFLLRVLPPEKALHYYENGSYTGISAHSLEEFRDTILLVSLKSIEFHVMSNDLENWLEYTVGDKELAQATRMLKGLGLRGDELQRRLHDVVKTRCDALKSALT